MIEKIANFIFGKPEKHPCDDVDPLYAAAEKASNAGDYKEARRLLDAAMYFSEKANSLELITVTLAYKAINEIKARCWDDAGEFLKQAIQIIDENGQNFLPATKHTALTLFATVCLYLEKLDQAIHFSRKAMDQCQNEASLDDTYVSTSLTLASALTCKGAFDESLSIAETMLEKKDGEAYDACQKILQGVFNVAIASGQVDLAQRVNKQLAEVLGQKDEQTRDVIISSNNGVIHLFKGNYDKCIECLPPLNEIADLDHSLQNAIIGTRFMVALLENDLSEQTRIVAALDEIPSRNALYWENFCYHILQFFVKEDWVKIVELFDEYSAKLREQLNTHFSRDLFCILLLVAFKRTSINDAKIIGDITTFVQKKLDNRELFQIIKDLISEEIDAPYCNRLKKYISTLETVNLNYQVAFFFGAILASVGHIDYSKEFYQMCIKESQGCSLVNALAKIELGRLLDSSHD